MSKTAVIIPARYASTRLKGKLLMEAGNKPVIQWVWEAAKKAKTADAVIIATDSELIFNKAKDFGADVEMTRADHKSGSDRIAEVAARHNEFDYIVNLQGDEPQMTPDVIDLAVNALKQSDADISTLVHKIDKTKACDPNCVKCVFDNNYKALYFSRSKIPYERNENEADCFGHIGLYVYKRESLIKMTSLEQADIERAESLEQLRALKNGMKITVAITELNPIGIDTQEDLNEFIKRMK